MITVIAVGKKHEDWVLPGLERYEKRLKTPFNVTWTLLPHSSLQANRARLEESERIRTKLKTSDHVILLDETGIRRTSPDLSVMLSRLFVDSKDAVMIIGGAYGVDDSLKARANEVLSLSDLVFPHQLVRLLLIEQLYRSQEIWRQSPYHHQ